MDDGLVRLVREVVREDWGPGAPAAVVAALERYAQREGFTGSDVERRNLKQVLRAIDRACPQAGRRGAYGTAQRRSERRAQRELEKLVKAARADKHLLAFRSAWGLPVALRAQDEPDRGDELYRAWAALPEPAREELTVMVQHLVRASGWTPIQCLALVIADRAPDPPPAHLELVDHVSEEKLAQLKFALDKITPGRRPNWRAICQAWNLKHPLDQVDAENYKGFANDVARTKQRLLQAARREEAAAVVKALMAELEADAVDMPLLMRLGLGLPPRARAGRVEGQRDTASVTTGAGTSTQGVSDAAPSGRPRASRSSRT